MLKNKISFVKDIRNRDIVSESTHDFYRYPARFSPFFARTVIKEFTKPHDLVIDPFMGSGTTLVEASLLKRNAIGSDISTLARFISKVKTTPLSKYDLSMIRKWHEKTYLFRNLDYPIQIDDKWIKSGYQKNIDCHSTWRITKQIELFLNSTKYLSNNNQKDFARCTILRTAQWAFDCKKSIPPINSFRSKFDDVFFEMTFKAREYSEEINRVWGKTKANIVCFNMDATKLGMSKKIRKHKKPKLILTSPPYPGVHILYHRWQIKGRKESPAPFWIVNCLDGNSESFYTFGHRKSHNLNKYYLNLKNSFSSIAKLCDKNTIIVQLLSFSNKKEQFNKYLQVMEETGFKEIDLLDSHPNKLRRIWRFVPNRKWYANNKGMINSSKEVVLFHKLY